MNVRTILLLAVACSLLTPLAHAGWRTQGYVAVMPWALAGVQCNDTCGLGVAQANLGGYEFAADGRTPTEVFVQDDVGDAVYFVACQDANRDGLCGTMGDPVVTACGSTASLAGKGFSAARETTVFVYSMDPARACAGTATTGFISLLTQ